MYRAEIHMHTTASDGQLEPGEAVRHARRLGLAAIAVTDHNTFKGSQAAAREAAGLGIVVVYGNEVRTSWGDTLLLCPEEPPGEREWRGMNPHVLREIADGWGCILVAAHPYHLGRSSVGGRAWRRDIFHAVEVWNARGPPILNVPALIGAWRRGVPATSGSDAHVRGEIGVAPIVLEEEPRRPVDVLEEILRGRVRPTYGVPGPGALIEAARWGLARRRGSRVAW